jgi:hypothetical protein
LSESSAADRLLADLEGDAICFSIGDLIATLCTGDLNSRFDDMLLTIHSQQLEINGTESCGVAQLGMFIAPLCWNWGSDAKFASSSKVFASLIYIVDIRKYEYNAQMILRFEFERRG